MTEGADDEVAERHARQAANEQGLIVNQRTNPGGAEIYQVKPRLIDAKVDGELKQQQKNRGRTKHLPEQSLPHQPCVAIGDPVTAGSEDPISAPTEGYRNHEMANSHGSFVPAYRGVIANKECNHYARHSRHAIKQHQRQ